MAGILGRHGRMSSRDRELYENLAGYVNNTRKERFAFLWLHAMLGIIPCIFFFVR